MAQLSLPVAEAQFWKTRKFSDERIFSGNSKEKSTYPSQCGSFLKSTQFSVARGSRGTLFVNAKTNSKLDQNFRTLFPRRPISALRCSSRNVSNGARRRAWKERAESSVQRMVTWNHSSSYLMYPKMYGELYWFVNISSQSCWCRRSSVNWKGM